MGIGRVLDIAVRTMSTYQQALNVTSNNISNANNPDYSRQQIIFASAPSDSAGGTGVVLQDVVRVRDSMLDKQIYKFQSDNSDSTKRSSVLQQVESIISEPSDNGLSAYFSSFFNSWSQLTADPTSSQARLDVIQNAQNLSSRFKDVYDSLNEEMTSLQKEAVIKVNSINTYLQQINSYNQKIYQAAGQGLQPNDLMDSRDALITQLSQLVNISVQDGPNGTSNVSVAGAQGADLNSYNQFTIKSINGKMVLVSQSDPNTSLSLTSGELYATTDMYSNVIPSYKTSLDNLANAFISNVNQIHMQGNTLVQGGASSTGIPFFGQLDGSGNVINAYSDGLMQINADIVNNPKNIAASDTAGNDGNGNQANKIALLADQPISALGDLSVTDYYSNILNSIGIDKTNSDNKVQSGTAILQQLQTQQSSTSGVSLDEEMTQVLKFQRSYDAASKLIKVSDEMLQTLLNMVG